MPKREEEEKGEVRVSATIEELLLGSTEGHDTPTFKSGMK